MPWLRCLPLFLLLLLHSSTAILPPFWDRVLKDDNCSEQTDCGWPGISATECRGRGCCWDVDAQHWCTGTVSQCQSQADCSGHGKCVDGACVCDAGRTGHTCADTLITKVHLIQSCHLDVGFTDSSAGVINRYLSHHIPTAIASANAMRNHSRGWRVRFMAQSYYLGFYLDCPPNMGFQCPTTEQKEQLRAAIARGDIHWHAFPHNAELENTSPVMLDEGVKATQALDAAFGLPSKRTLSQRDVPGVPRSVIPILNKNGVDMISVGVNGASMYPKVPKMFEWLDPVSNKSILAMWHPKGYGGYSASEAVTMPGWNQALVTDWIGDNAGPGTVEHYESVFEAIQKEFPNATVVASSFDEWLDEVNQSGLRASLPLVQAEVGDSWIYGVPSDPKKISVSRAIDRALTRYLEAGGERDPAYLNFTRLAVKNCEHTWGRDVKSNLKQNNNSQWANSGFETGRTVGEEREQYGVLEESWWEQRRWGKDIPLEALPQGHSLLALVNQEISNINQEVPTTQGYMRVNDPSAPISCGHTSIAFDNLTGAIVHLSDTSVQPSRQWAAPGRTLLSLGYRTYSQLDFHVFQQQYSNLTHPPSYFPQDFGKPGETLSNHSVWKAQLESAWSKPSQNSTSFLLRSVIVDDHGSPDFAHTHYGAPNYFMTELVVQHEPSEQARVGVTIWCVNKTSTRLPETMFVSFNPSPSQGLWEMQKLGQWQSTKDVVAGGSKHLHGVSIGSGMRYTAAGGATLGLEAVDTPVMNLGEPLGFPVPCERVENPWNTDPDLAQFGVSSIFWNNLWGTNYVQWFPYNSNYRPVAGEENFISRYNLNF